MSEIRIGFEVGTSEEVAIPIFHTGLFGITQSGKTETLKAMALKAVELGYTLLIIDVKKNPAGARDFEGFGLETPIYLKETTDPLVLKGLLESESHLRLSFQFPELIKACEGTSTIQEVLDNMEELLRIERIHPVRKDKLEVLRLLLKRLLEEIKQVAISETLELRSGKINVMDVTPYSEAFKQMVVKCVAEHVRQNLKDIILVFDESHIQIPQKYLSASKRALTTIIKEGAGSKQYVWLADQTIVEVDKNPLKQVDIWIIGRQRELNEAQRAYKQLPYKHGISVEDIMRLSTGHFYVSTSQWVKQTYIQPLWLDDETAKRIAVGELSPRDVSNIKAVDDLKFEQMWKEEKRKREELEARVSSLETSLKGYEDLQTASPQIPPNRKVSLKKRISLEHQELIVEVSHTEETVQMTTKTGLGRIMFVAINDLPREGFAESDISNALSERGWVMPHSTLAPNLGGLCKRGYLIKEKIKRPIKYRLPSLLKINVKEEKTP